MQQENSNNVLSVHLLSSGLLPSAPEFHRIGLCRGRGSRAVPPVGNYTQPRRNINCVTERIG